jgi:hypothetical protein
MRPKCSTCGASLPAVALFCPRCGSATNLQPSDEREIYRRGNVLVTSRRVVLAGATLSLSNIAGVSVERRQNYRRRSATKILAGMMLLIGGFVIAASGGGIRGLWLPGSIGLWLILWALLRAAGHRRWYLLVLRTSNGIETLKFDAPEPAQDVAAAIAAAMAERDARDRQT